MGLLNNGTINNLGGGLSIGGPQALLLSKCRHVGEWINFSSRDTGYLSLASYPTGYYNGSYLPRTSGEVASQLGLQSTAVVTANAAGGINIESALAASGVMAGTGQLVVSGSANLTASLSLSGNIVAALAAAANLSASGSVSGTLNAHGFMTSGLTGTLSTSFVPNAIGHLECDITPFTELSPTTLAAELLDNNDVEAGLTVREAFRLISAACAGIISGAATNTITFRSAVADDKERIIAVVDASGNRTLITYDLT